MLITFKLERPQLDALIECLDAGEELYRMDWQEAFHTINTFGYSKYSLVGKANKYINEMEKAFIDICNKRNIQISQDGYDDSYAYEVCSLHADFFEERNKHDKQYYEFELNWSERELEVFENILDIVPRIVLGQWEYLFDIFEVANPKAVSQVSIHSFPSSTWLFTYRNLIFNVFNANEIHGKNASLGIAHIALSEKVRSVYEIYKEFMYQYRCVGVYDAKRFKWAKDDCKLPEISFPVEYLFTYDGDVEKAKAILDTGSRKCIFYENDTYPVFVPYENNMSRGLVPRDVVCLNKNGYYTVIAEK